MIQQPLMAEYVAELSRKQWNRIKKEALVHVTEHYSRYYNYRKKTSTTDLKYLYAEMALNYIGSVQDEYEEYSPEERNVDTMHGSKPRGFVGLETEGGMECFMFYYPKPRFVEGCATEGSCGYLVKSFGFEGAKKLAFEKQEEMYPTV
jgi:hypothetical protein